MSDQRTIREAIEVIRRRWPAALPDADECTPVFLLAAGWRSGSTLLQRMMMRHCFVWGEPFGHACPIPAMAEMIRCLTDGWPEPHFFYRQQPIGELERGFIANLYPSIRSLRAAHRNWFAELFRPPVEAGIDRWGLKEVRLSIDHAHYLKWLFPRARFLFLIRDPYAAFRSLAARRDAGWKWFYRWPDKPVTAELYGRLWSELAAGFLSGAREVGGLVVRYEQLRENGFTEIEDYLGFPLSAPAAEVKPPDGPSPVERLSAAEAEVLHREVQQVADPLGYTPGEEERPRIGMDVSRQAAHQQEQVLDVGVLDRYRRLVIGLGTGQCGLASLADLMNRQANCQMTFQRAPLLSWNPSRDRPQLVQRLERMRRQMTAPLFGDAASFYLPYVSQLIEQVPDCRIVCLQRPQDEVIEKFIEWLKRNHPVPTNHWARNLPRGWHHDPHLTRIYPQYPTGDLRDALARYWDEYAERASGLMGEFPEQFRVFDPGVALETTDGLADLLTFVGIPQGDRQIVTGLFAGRPDPDLPRDRPLAPRPSADPLDRRRCVILVPYTTHIVPQCDESLKELERRGYPVRRVVGFAAIDQGRNQMATDALLDGFEETMWIDADIGFHPDAVDRLRSHGLPICSGIYPQKGKRAIASHLMPGTKTLTFGKSGGLHEVLYAATGFLHVRREVYLQVQRSLDLPVCNERFRHPTIPFFQPKLHEIDDGTWYLAEDYAFSQRVRQTGIRIMADTAIRLWHYGTFAYGWEEAGREVDRFETFTLNFSKRRPAGETGA